MHVYLLAPGLFPREVGGDGSAWVQGLELPGLQLALSRGNPLGDGGRQLRPEALIFEAMGYGGPGPGYPVAAASRIADSGQLELGLFLRADPVNLTAELSGATLIAGSDLVLDVEEADVLIRLLRPGFSELACELEAVHPLRWYLRPTSTLPAIDTHAPELRPGLPGSTYLPGGRDGPNWRRVLTESEMLLHGAPSNEQRERTGRPLINSLWIWGGGALPESAPAPKCPWTRVCSDHPVAVGLARHGGIPVGPPDLETLMAGTDAGPRLVVIDSLYGPAGAERIEDWQQRLMELDRDWVTPLMSALNNRRLHRVVIDGGDGCGVDLSVRGVKRWWKRRRPLSQLWNEMT